MICIVVSSFLSRLAALFTYFAAKKKDEHTDLDLLFTFSKLDEKKKSYQLGTIRLSQEDRKNVYSRAFVRINKDTS